MNRGKRMTILSSTFAFFVSMICVLYLGLKFKYARENKGNVQKRRFKNVVDVSFSVSILIFAVMHVNSFLNSLQNAEESTSYMNYIIVLILAYFVWALFNVKKFRKEREALEKTQKKRK